MSYWDSTGTDDHSKHFTKPTHNSEMAQKHRFLLRREGLEYHSVIRMSHNDTILRTLINMFRR